jgi:hypothetical protein
LHVFPQSLDRSTEDADPTADICEDGDRASLEDAGKRKIGEVDFGVVEVGADRAI